MLIRRLGATTKKDGSYLLLAGTVAGVLGFNALAFAHVAAPEDGTTTAHATTATATSVDTPATPDAQAAAGTTPASETGNRDRAKATALEEVVVTARKRKELVQNVPMSISVLTGERLKRDGDDNFRDIGTAFPGVSFNDSNGQGGEFSIRGLTSTGSGSDTSIGLYVDGVYIGSEAAMSQRLFDLSNIQVLRGPQGTLFGRNTVAGAINIVTRKPEPVFGGSVNATVGNYGLRQAGATLNLPIVSDRLMARISVVDRKRDGYLKNTAKPGDSGNNEDGQSARLHVLAKPTDTLQLLFSADRSRDHTCDNMFKVVGGALYDGNTDPDVSAWDGPCRDHSDVKGYSLQADQQLGDLIFTSITAYRDRTSNFLTDRDFTALPILTTGLDLDDRHFTQEFRLTSPGGQSFNWVVGTFFFNRHDFQNTILDLGPGFLGPGNSNLVQAIAYSTDKSYAGYASGEWVMSEKFKLDLGLRYTNESKAVDYVQTATLPIPGFSPVAPFHKSISGGEWSPTLTATYALNPQANIYARVARGHKSGGFNAGPSSNPDQVVFQPETLTSYETGYKTKLLDDRLEFDGDIYYLDYKNIQQSNQNGAGFYISNAASARSYGAETQAALHLGDNAIVNASLGYVDAKYEVFGNKSGNALPRAPKWTGALNLDLSWNAGGSGSLFVIPEVAYRGANYVDSANTPLFVQRGHTEINLRVGYESYSGWSITAWTRNATDQRYTLGGFAVAPILYAISSSPPRTYGVDFQWTF
ncbi:MAG TPA: TonB-dependent receptor [Rhodanobacter sp.]|nr:TonB-dependent receptor [Rhodanobacter sp.]